MQNESSFLETVTVCSESIMSYLFSNLRKRGVKMNMKKIIMICSVIVSFLGPV